MLSKLVELPGGGKSTPTKYEERNRMLTFDEYEYQVWPLAQYPSVGTNILYPTLGLVGEAGEVAEKVKKLWRNKQKCHPNEYTNDEKLELIKELGDVLWYIMALANELGFDLHTVADVNMAKLLERNERGVIKSEGDNR